MESLIFFLRSGVGKERYSSAVVFPEREWSPSSRERNVDNDNLEKVLLFYFIYLFIVHCQVSVQAVQRVEVCKKDVRLESPWLWLVGFNPGFGSHFCFPPSYMVFVNNYHSLSNLFLSYPPLHFNLTKKSILREDCLK